MARIAANRTRPTSKNGTIKKPVAKKERAGKQQKKAVPEPPTVDPQTDATVDKKKRARRPGLMGRKRLLYLAAGRDRLKSHITAVSMRKILRNGYNGRVSRACTALLREYAQHFIQTVTAKATQLAALNGSHVRVTDDLLRYAAKDLGERGFAPCVSSEFPHAGSDTIIFPANKRIPSLFCGTIPPVHQNA